PDIGYLREVAAMRVNLSLDQFGKQKYLPDRERIRLIAALVEQGYGRQVMIGGDMARRSYFVSYNGGPGLAHIPGAIAASLHEQIGPVALHELLIDNPRRWLAFVPRTDLLRAQ